MRILFFSSYFHPYVSGLSNAPLPVLKHLSQKNKLTVLTFQHDKKLKKQETFGKIKIIRMPYLFKISKGFFSPQSLSYFVKETKNSDLVILNLPNFEAFFLALLAKLYGKKVISIYNCRVSSDKNIFLKIAVYFLNLSVFFQLMLSDTIIAYPDYIEHLFVGRLFKDKIRITLPPIQKPDVNISTFKKYKSLKKDKVWIGYVGRIAQEKGIEYLIKALKNLELDYELLFAGPTELEVAGEKQYFLKIKKLLKSNMIPHGFLGKLEDNALGAFYKAIDLLVLPSINQTEAFGIVQVEAMLVGTPVVATNLPGVRVPIKLTQMGEIVEPKNSHKLTLAILKVIKNRSKYTNEKLVDQAKKILNRKEVYDFYSRIIGG